MIISGHLSEMIWMISSWIFLRFFSEFLLGFLPGFYQEFLQSFLRGPTWDSFRDSSIQLLIASGTSCVITASILSVLSQEFLLGLIPEIVQVFLLWFIPWIHPRISLGSFFWYWQGWFDSPGYRLTRLTVSIIYSFEKFDPIVSVGSTYTWTP